MSQLKTPMKSHEKYVIIHLDLDCFYAQVEEVENPKYRDLPLGIQQNQTISTVNYCGRIKYKIPKMTRVKQALEMCPELIVIPARMEIYREESRKIFDECIGECVNSFHGDCVLEVCGIDEAYINVTDEVNWRLENATELGIDVKDHRGRKVSKSVNSQDNHLNIGSQIAEEIRCNVFNSLGYTISAGIAHSKFLSKLASKKQKPNGQALIYSESFDEEINSQDVSIIPNVGYTTKQKLAELCQISTVKQLRAQTYVNIIKCFNSDKAAIKVLNIANGKFDEEYDRVVSKGPPKSIGSELTFLTIQTYEDFEQKLRTITGDLFTRIQRDLKRNSNRYATKLTLRYCHGSYRDPYHSVSCKITSNIYNNLNNYEEKDESNIHSLVIKMFKQKVSLPFKLQRMGVSVSDFVEPPKFATPKTSTIGTSKIVNEEEKREGNLLSSFSQQSSNTNKKRKADSVSNGSQGRQTSITSFLKNKGASPIKKTKQ
ncbi:predicted protein [Naegleria gruberi]|uniref:Predicted protein n=1 Tax=Naegleria gruberi TaxID=5762 RepID=D2VGP4_NAEGR|nr:uncharacterized protein NAEGRDRAFT_68049 [Naegleria gruberi]EFC44003.1 predicted protein [Naegleria gruberi]|eukprot:XP_002676747.1 predicted protein [Naegleria gruberi strain NEG-M]